MRLEYEAYVPMARSEIRKICKQVREKWDVIKIAIFHRIGYVLTNFYIRVVCFSSVEDG